MLSSIRRFVVEAHRRDRFLSFTAWAHVVLALAFAVFAVLDSRVVLGLDPWVKPFKFAVSIAIYCFSMAWFLGHLGRGLLRRALSIVMGVAMWVEIVCIAGQAARGTTSHFNSETAFDGAVFSVMGSFIALNTVAATVLFLVLAFGRNELPPGTYRWGVLAGLLVFLVGSGVGGQLVANNAHTVGAVDGGPGLPMVNWSTEAGDLRVAHALGLHALQVLPLAGFLLATRRDRVEQQGANRILLASGSVLYFVAVLALYAQAMSGQPLLPAG